MTEQRTSPAGAVAGDGRDRPGPFTIEDSARRIGHYRWIEMRLFELLGGWVEVVPELEVKLRLGTHCYHHAWHAELWHDRLPDQGELAVDHVTAPANDALVDFMGALAEPAAPELTIEKLVGVYRVLIPRKIAAYSFHLDMASAVADEPVIRSLKFALGDEIDDWREGEVLLQSLIATPDQVRRATERQATLEAVMVGAGGIAGAGSIGPPLGAS